MTEMGRLEDISLEERGKAGDIGVCGGVVTPRYSSMEGESVGGV